MIVGISSLLLFLVFFLLLHSCSAFFFFSFVIVKMMMMMMMSVLLIDVPISLSHLHVHSSSSPVLSSRCCPSVCLCVSRCLLVVVVVDSARFGIGLDWTEREREIFHHVSHHFTSSLLTVLQAFQTIQPCILINQSTMIPFMLSISLYRHLIQRYSTSNNQQQRKKKCRSQASKAKQATHPTRQHTDRQTDSKLLPHPTLSSLNTRSNTKEKEKERDQ